jgi:hypothetical protein
MYNLQIAGLERGTSEAKKRRREIADHGLLVWRVGTSATLVSRGKSA